MKVRGATPADCRAMSEVLRELLDAGKRTKPSAPDFVRLHYIEHPAQIRCSVALDETGHVLGFQSLKRSVAGNPYQTPLGWGIIGTHVRPRCARQGIGRRLFSATLEAARSAGLPAIEAFIGAENAEAIAYYEALGFTTYRRAGGADCKRLLLL